MTGWSTIIQLNFYAAPEIERRRRDLGNYHPKMAFLKQIFQGL